MLGGCGRHKMLSFRSGGVLLAQLQAEIAWSTQFDLLIGLQLDSPSDHVALDRQLPCAHVDQRGEYDTGRSTIIKELVHAGPNGPPAHHNVNHEEDMTIFGFKGQM